MNTSIQIEIDKNNKHSSALGAAYADSLKMILQHVADFHLTVVDIISEKYNIPVDEIMNTVASDSRYANMLVDPKIHRLTSSPNQNQVVETTPTITATQLAATVPKKLTEKKIKIKPKNSIVIPPSSS